MGRSRRPAASLVTLVSRHSSALYSGMVPGVVAGLYGKEEAAIDLRRLCRLAQVTFVQAEITGLTPEDRELRLEGRPPLRFDRLSLDVGAVTAVTGSAVAVKPLEPFLAWAARRRPADAPLRIRGGGAAAVELALAFRARGIASRLLLRGGDLHLGSTAANHAGEGLLAEAGIPVERWVGSDQPADLACTGSRAPAWLAAAGLPTDPASGRVLTEASLAVVGHPDLFASGDCGVIASAPRPPSGVWAVRAAPVLAVNLARCLDTPAVPLRRWRPQRWALQLLGDGGWRPRGPRALACWGPLVLGPHRGLWTWKDRIDRRFMDRFQLRMDVAPMACRGCAAKLAPQPLAHALARSDPGGAPPAAEDAPVVGRDPGGNLQLQSVDGFPALVDDPWLNGRLTTLHACGDLWASGADVRSVQVVATLPEATPSLQEELLVQSLAGVRSVLEPLGARLIGGHTLEGRDGAGLALALTVNGLAPAGRHWAKGPLQPGDALLLSRPLGTGVLFAAAMAGAARPRWIEAALAAMDRSQASLVALLARHGCRACTDVTGFGLLGHLGEMIGEDVVVRLDGEAVPALPGALELLEQGHASTLAPANAVALGLLGGPVRLADAAGAATAARQALWIDPQTCGPLLAALPAERTPAALDELHRAGFGDAALIAQVETAAA
jgi:selenide,water dikinase